MTPCLFRHRPSVDNSCLHHVFKPYWVLPAGGGSMFGGGLGTFDAPVAAFTLLEALLPERGPLGLRRRCDGQRVQSILYRTKCSAKRTVRTTRVVAVFEKIVLVCLALGFATRIHDLEPSRSFRG